MTSEKYKQATGGADTKFSHTSYPTFCRYKNKSPGMSAYPKEFSEAKGEAHTRDSFEQWHDHHGFPPPNSPHSLT